MRNRLSFVIAFSVALVLAGCANQGPGKTGGAIVGGGLGALAGSQFGKGKGQIVATGVGTLLGAILGSALGEQYDQNDRRYAQDNIYDTLNYAPDGTTRTWRNPNTGLYGRTTVYSSGYSCRSLNTVTYDRYGNMIGSGRDTYCRDAYGNWYDAGY